MNWKEFVDQNKDSKIKAMIDRAKQSDNPSTVEIFRKEQEAKDEALGFKIGEGNWGYLYVKVGDKWITHANIVWEETYGKLLEDWSVHHIDEDKLHDDLINLVALPKKLHFLQHSKKHKGELEWCDEVIKDFIKFAKIRKSILDLQENMDSLESDSSVDDLKISLLSQFNKELLLLKGELEHRYDIIVDFLGRNSKIYFKDTVNLFSEPKTEGVK